MHGLVHAAAVGDEPEVDDPERGDDLADDPGLLRDLADGGVLGGLALLDVALGQRPEQPAAPVGAADQGGAGPGHSRPRPPPGPRRRSRRPGATGGRGVRARPSQPCQEGSASRPALLWPVVSADALRSRPSSAEPVPPAVQADRAGAGRPLPRARPSSASASPRPGSRLHLVGGSVRDALLARRPAGAAGARRPRLHHRRPARSRCSSCCAAGPVPRGTPASRSARSAPRCAASAWRSPPSGPTATTGSRRNPEVAWGDSLVDDLVRRDFTVNAMAVSLGPDRTVTDPFGGLGDLLRQAAAHARRRRATPSPTTRCGCCGPPGSWPSWADAGRRGGRGDDRAGRRAGADHPRAGAGGAVQDAAAGLAPARRWSCSSTPAWPTSSCRSCRRCGWRSTSTTSTRTSTSTR